MFGLGFLDFIADLFGFSSDKKVEQKNSNKKQSPVVYHKVKQGETLYSIAKANGISVETLKAANGIKGDMLSVGQNLKIPSKSSETIFPKTKKADNSGFQMYREISDEEIARENARNKFVKITKNPPYTIKEGDTAELIAKKFNVSPDAIIALNSLDEKKLKIGTVIKIPETRTVRNVKNINDVAKATGLSLEYLKSLEILEDKHNKIYTDRNGVKTIGIGHALSNSEAKKFAGKTFSDAQIYTMLAQDLVDREQNIKLLIGDATYKKMPQPVKDSVMDFVFNRGETVFENKKDLISSLQKGDYKSAILKMDTDYSIMKFNSKAELNAYVAKFKDKRIFVVEKDGKTLKKYLSGLDKRRLFEIAHASKIYKNNIPKEIISSAQNLYNRGLYFLSIETQNRTYPQQAYQNIKADFNILVNDWFDGKIKMK